VSVLAWRPYQRALALPGAPGFVSAGFIARLPMSMVPLGIVLAVSGITGTYALAGALSATYALSAAIGSPLTSRIVDRRGQHRVLPALAGLHAAALVALVVSLVAAWPIVVQFACAASAGALVPAIGAFVRARWAAKVHQQGPPAPAGAALDDQPDVRVTLSTAFAIESILDEVAYTIGPLLAASLAAAAGAPIPLVVATGLGLAGALLLAGQRRSEPAPRPAIRHPAGSPDRQRLLRTPGMPTVLATLFGIGIVFGAYEVAVVAFCSEAGAPAATGIVLGIWAVGSMIAGIWFGGRHWQAPIARQLTITTGLVALTVVPALLVPNVLLLTVSTMIAGAAFAPSLICLFALTEQAVPSARLTEGLAWSQSAIMVGFALGAALGGAGVDAWGPSLAFGIPLAAGIGTWALWLRPAPVWKPVR